MSKTLDKQQDTPLARVDAYLSGLGLGEQRCAELREQVAADQPDSHEQAMQALYDALARTGGANDHREAELAARIEAAYPSLAQRRQEGIGGGGYRGASMPGLDRCSMSPTHIDRRPWRFLDRLIPGLGRRRHLPKAVPSRLKNVVRLRQIILFFLVALPALGATFYMLTVLPHQGGTILELIILAFAALLFAWILVGFWSAMAGFFVLVMGDKHLVSAPPDQVEHNDPNARTALLMPIHEEDVQRSFAGIQAMYESLQQAGRLDEFDFFILSDSVNPDTIAAEERAWADTCRRLDAFDRIFYRRRRARVRRKSGNVADFCRRWGGAYRYMIILDADSTMIGSTLTAMVDRMEANPEVGLIQTPPTAVNRSSVLARVQQFATRVYGRMFAAGLHYWHLDNAHYWGHNAIIRVKPFMEYCALPRLPGRGAFAGEIMSHDIVEAALMRRAGWGVYIAYDLPGSYEELPPSLIDELGRDRRWCQGNLQHIRLLFSDNLAPAHRALFANGVMAYTSAAFWFVFLVLSSSEAVMEAVSVPNYFPSPGSLFPDWPVWQPVWAVSLFISTMVVLFLPKVVGIAIIISRGEARDYGGVGNLIASSLIEIVLTSLLAPVRMLSHTFFVFTTLLGIRVGWGSQQREDAQVPWSAALRFHLPGMILAVVWGLILYTYTPGFFPWLLPILLPLFIAPVLTVLTSRADMGIWMRRHGLQLIPEEQHSVPVLGRILEIEGSNADFTDLLIDPGLQALHSGLEGSPRHYGRHIAGYRQQLARRVLKQGPDILSDQEKRDLMSDPEQMAWLHRSLWSQPSLPDWMARKIKPAA